MTWTDRAACRDGTYAAQLTSDDRDVALAAARAVCPDCPVKAECARHGWQETQRWTYVVGVYGGRYISGGRGAEALRRTRQRQREAS